MIAAFANSFKIPELKQRILFTLAMIVIARIGAAIALPGVDMAVLQAWLHQAGDDTGQTLTTLLNVFSGGGIQNCAILALGIMPYISASIMMQLMTAIVPSLSKLARETGGRQKISQWTRYVTIILCLIQGYMMAVSLEYPEKNPLLGGLVEYLKNHPGEKLIPQATFGWYFIAVVSMTAGTMFLMWLGEQITERGVGNGISILISVNILSDLPNALVSSWQKYLSPSALQTGNPAMNAAMVLIFLVLFLLTIMAIITLTQAIRKVPINYAKRMVGKKMFGGQNTHLPLRLNYSGVMPIIFASAIIGFPTMIAQMINPNGGFSLWLQNTFTNFGWPYVMVYGILIFFFAYFWVATMFQPQQIAEDLKTNGGYIPGIRPGKPTADFLDFTMTRLTFAGALSMFFVAIVPSALTSLAGIDGRVSQFFGGTSILILVGVILDMMRQIETHLLQRHYDGFLRKGRIRGRYDRPGNVESGKGPAGGRLVALYALFAALILIAIVYSMSKKGL